MTTVEEIEAAIESLPHEEYVRLVEWFRERDGQAWDDQIDRDAASGKLDFLIEEARDEQRKGLLRPWPPPD